MFVRVVVVVLDVVPVIVVVSAGVNVILFTFIVCEMSLTLNSGVVQSAKLLLWLRTGHPPTLTPSITFTATTVGINTAATTTTPPQKQPPPQPQPPP